MAELADYFGDVVVGYWDTGFKDALLVVMEELPDLGVDLRDVRLRKPCDPNPPPRGMVRVDPLPPPSTEHAPRVLIEPTSPLIPPVSSPPFTIAPSMEDIFGAEVPEGANRGDGSIPAATAADDQVPPQHEV